MHKIHKKNVLLLLLTSLIWGTAFVAQSTGMEYLGPYTFNMIRFFIGGLVLIPSISFLDRWNAGQGVASKKPRTLAEKKILLKSGILCGILLCAASTAQQVGIQYTTVGKAGFITALYIIIVPILGIFIGKKMGIKVWMSVVIALVGLYLLCMNGSFSLQKGDVLVLLCGLIFSFHIIVVDKYAPLVDGVRLSCIQFFVSGTISAVLTAAFETVRFSDVKSAMISLLYAGVLSCGVAYTLQIIGQNGADPTIASLLMSLESVFSVLGGWVILHQTLTGREVLGCALMFGAIVLSQLKGKEKDEECRLDGQTAS